MDWMAATLLRTDPALARRVMTLAWPAVAEQTLAMMIGLVDFYIVGHLGAAALDGVGLGGQILNLTVAFLGAVGVGSTALVARHIGAKEPDDATHTAQQSIVVAAVIGLLMALVGLIFARPIIAWFGGEPDVIEQGTRYLRTIAPSFLFFSVLLIGNAVLRGAGDTRTPLLIMMVVNVINIGVAWSLTQGVAGLPKLGVIGSGLGAASAQTTGGIIALWLLVRGRAGIRIGLRWPRLIRPHPAHSQYWTAGGRRTNLFTACAHQSHRRHRGFWHRSVCGAHGLVANRPTFVPPRVGLCRGRFDARRPRIGRQAAATRNGKQLRGISRRVDHDDDYGHRHPSL